MFKNEEDKNKRVSWATKDRWLAALKQIADKENLSFIIDWDNKLVSVKGINKEDNNSETFKVLVENEKSILKLRKGQNLQERLQKWLKVYGYDLVWNLDYNIIVQTNANIER